MGPGGPVAAPARLHPFSLVRGIDPRGIVQTIPALAVLLAQFGGVSVAGVVVALAVLAAVRLVAWQRHTYELTGDAVVERRGVLQRRERTLQLARLQQVEVEQGVLDRFMGTAVLRLETAGDTGDAELELKVVTEEQARQLRASLLRHVDPVDTDRTPPLVAVPLSHVVLAAVTGPRLLAVPVLMAGAIGIAADLDLVSADPASVVSRLRPVGVAAALGLLVALVLVSTAVAIVVGLLRDGEFSLRRVGDDLHVRRGLLSTREAVVPLQRVQVVVVQRSMIRRALGFATVTIRSAGGVGSQGAGERRLTVPLLPDAAVAQVVGSLFDRADELPRLVAHPPAARRRAVIRHVRRVTPALLALAAVAWWTGMPVPVVLSACGIGWALAACVGAVSHRHRASGASSALLAGRSGALGLTTVFAPRDKTQGVVRRTSPFQRRVGLATMQVHVAGPGATLTLVDLDATRASELQAALLRRR